MMPALLRRHAMGALAGCGAGLWAWSARVAPAQAAQAGLGDWPAWSRFKTQFLRADGRVEDPDSPRRHTVSEGQAYALFFALVANDRPAFERVLRWTEDNLCQGDLTAHLPAWQWGRQDNGQWGVIDSNPASDADLWMVYALGEAARLWNVRRYSALASLLGQRILREECAELPGLGLTLLPGPKGFALGAGRWRLNASYCPPQVMAWMERNSTDNAAWARLAESAQRLIVGSAPKGYAGDWTVYDSQRGFVPDLDGAEKGQGSYNAIRVYLWAGSLHPQASGRAKLLRALQPMAQRVRSSGEVPESIDTQSGQTGVAAPPGFVAAMLPFLQAQQETTALQQQRDRLQAQPLRDHAYYEQALGLFALGWMDGFYRFAADGSLQARWSRP